MMYILFKYLVFTCSDLKLSIFWKIKKEGSKTYSDGMVHIWKCSQEIFFGVLSQVYFTYQ